MVDLKGQYDRVKANIDQAISEVLNSSLFINGPAVHDFAEELSKYNEVEYTIPCGNGTDALQIAMMALDFKPGDEVIVPSFTYVATAEVIALLRLVPVLIDVEAETFNIDPREIEKNISKKTVAIVAVHLFGQCANMDEIMDIAQRHNLHVIEDAAQAIGATYTFKNGKTMKAGTMGTIGTTSFFPSKNLGCYGDGGALFTRDPALAEKIRMIANHGQKIKYYHDIVGVNSRLDTIQAAILRVKLTQLDNYCESRKQAAVYYDRKFEGLDSLITPKRIKNSSHVFHQYTLKLERGDRDALKNFLQSKGIPSMIYYPVPLHRQKAYENINNNQRKLDVSEDLCSKVLSLPIHTELDQSQLDYISEAVIEYFN